MSLLLLQGTATHIPLADESVQCIVTSPPYWGLRDYGVSGQLGLEPTPDLYVEHMVVVFREVRRVLRPDGTLWLNLGDSYAADTKWGGASGDKNSTSAAGGFSRERKYTGLKDKDLIGIPWLVAFALRADGWWLRAENIWHKPNAMPESVIDRTTRAHEQVFMLTKAERYFYDADAISQPVSPSTHARISQTALQEQQGGPKQDAYEAGEPGRRRHDRRPSEIVKSMGRKPGVNPKAATNEKGSKQNASWSAATAGSVLTRNARSVWTIPTQSYPGAHFATFSEALVEPCVLAGSAVGDVVLDPFAGTSTTGRVALRHGRGYVGLDISREYLTEHSLRRTDPIAAARRDVATGASTQGVLEL